MLGEMAELIVGGLLHPRGGTQSTRRLLRRQSEQAGLPPGTLVQPVEAGKGPLTVTLINFGGGQFEQLSFDSLAPAFNVMSKTSMSWLGLTGAENSEAMAEMGVAFDVDPLILEDILNTDHRPKWEELRGQLYLRFNSLRFGEESAEVLTNQVSLLVGRRFVVSLSEEPVAHLDRIVNRIKNRTPRLQGLGPSYLAYAIIDLVVDNYFNVIEQVGERLAAAESGLLAAQVSKSTLGEIHHLQTQLVFLRKWIWPLRDIVRDLAESDSPLISDEVNPYLKDLYDHIIETIDTVTAYESLLAGLVNLYHSVVTSSTNEAMRVLTVVTTIFIPLSFVAGVYGMNFKNMPELGWPWAYPALLALMALAGGLMFLVYRIKRWV